MKDLNILLTEICEIVREASRIMLENPNAAVHQKAGHCNFVTDADVRVQQQLIEKLSALLPEAQFFAEEQENPELTDAPTFIIDPIDGTTNFMRDCRASCISVALLRERKPVLGVIYDPYTDELFTALAGCGALLNGRQIRVSTVPFENAIVAMGTSPYNSELARRSCEVSLRFLLESGDTRRLGTAALEMCYLACGRRDIFCELRLSPWDFAAASLIVTEAGGIFATPIGADDSFVDYAHPGCVLCANRECYEKALELVSRD